jgi:ferredoxin-NADP reductase
MHQQAASAASTTTTAAAAAAGFVAARLTKSLRLAEGVKRFDFQIDKHSADQFHFHPGQWVDFFIREIDEMTGYSMISSPLELPSLSFVVQLSQQSPAAVHVHETMRVDDVVWLRPGGSVTWDATSSTNDDALLLAGGIGVTPFASMLRHAELSSRVTPARSRAALLHSSRQRVLREELISIASASPTNLRYLHKDTDGSGDGRIDGFDIENALTFLKREKERVDGGSGGGGGGGISSSSNVVPFLCGSSPFIVSMEELLTNDFGYLREDIVVERWW